MTSSHFLKHDSTTQRVQYFLHNTRCYKTDVVVIPAFQARAVLHLISASIQRKFKTVLECVCGFCRSLSMTLMLNLTLTSLAGARQSLKVEMEIEQSRHAPYFINVTS